MMVVVGAVIAWEVFELWAGIGEPGTVDTAIDVVFVRAGGYGLPLR